MERKSRYLPAVKLTNKAAETMTTASARAFLRIPESMRKTLTVDNGKEFALFKQHEEKTGMRIYFADPYSAWLRGCNENTNGLLRQYFPKSSNFTALTENELAVAVKKLNYRPRKCLHYRTPLEVIHRAIHGALAT